ncbi:hypothetical protein N0V85_009510, partial [Neurospora sp. IMI 360204]
MSTPRSIDPNSNNNLYGPGPTSMGLDMGMLGGGGGGGGAMTGLLGGIGSGMGSSSSGNIQQQQPITSMANSMSGMPSLTSTMSTANFPNHLNLPLPNMPNMPNMPMSMSMSSLTNLTTNLVQSPHSHAHAHAHTHSPHSGHTHTGGQKPIRRRMRMITSCLECRRRKLKCNKCKPCVNCQKFNRECLYLGPKLDEASQMRLTEIKEQVGSLERALERDVAKGAASSSSGQR